MHTYQTQLLQDGLLDAILLKIDPGAINDFLDDRLIDVADRLVRHSRSCAAGKLCARRQALDRIDLSLLRSAIDIEVGNGRKSSEHSPRRRRRTMAYDGSWRIVDVGAQMGPRHVLPFAAVGISSSASSGDLKMRKKKK